MPNPGIRNEVACIPVSKSAAERDSAHSFVQRVSHEFSPCGRALVANGQIPEGQAVCSHSKWQVPHGYSLTQPRKHGLWQGFMYPGDAFCSMSLLVVDDACIGPSGNYRSDLLHQEIAWQPSPSQTSIYATKSRSGNVFLLDAKRHRPVSVWKCQDLSPPGKLANSEWLRLVWSPDGETLAVCQRGFMTFLRFGELD